MVRASHDEWDQYESECWQGLTQWLQANPEHPERNEVVEYLRNIQDEYFRYTREHLGWAAYVLGPESGPLR